MTGLQVESKKIVLTVVTTEERQMGLSQCIDRHLSNATVYHATDGPDALAKMNNVPPHIILLETNIPKVSGIRVAELVLGGKKFEDTTLIFLSSPPEQEMFLDEIVTGKIQFLGSDINEDKLVRALQRALNYLAVRSHTEYHLRFLIAGDVLLNQGDKADWVYIVRKGNLKACVTNGGVEVILGVINPGEFVGEMAYINGEPRSANVIATTDCELIEIPVGHLDHLLFQKPAWSKALMMTLSKRVKKLNQSKKA